MKDHLQAAYAGIVVELIHDDIFSHQNPSLRFALVNPANSNLNHTGGLAAQIC